MIRVANVIRLLNNEHFFNFFTTTAANQIILL